MKKTVEDIAVKAKSDATTNRKFNLPTVSQAVGNGRAKHKCIACSDTGFNSKGGACPVCEKGKAIALKLAPAKPTKAKAPAKPKEQPKEQPKAETVELNPEQLVTVKNRKGKAYSLPVKYFTHTGSLVPFDGAKSIATYCSIHNIKGKAKADAKKKYVEIQNTHNTMVCIGYAQLGKALDVRRLTSRRLVREPDVKAIAISGRTDADIPAIEALADATEFGKARRLVILAK